MTRSAAAALVLVILAGCASSGGRPAARDLTPPSEQTPTADANDANEAGTADFESLDKEFAQKTVTVPDPLEGWNRLMFQFNDVLYFNVLKPVGRAYKQITSAPVRTGVRNFFHNLSTPVRFVSCWAEGRADEAGMELGRFMVNTTWGILGVWDPAKDQLHLDPNDDEDLGQALAVHGVGHGFYIVWPLLGPSTLRDSVGLAAGQFLNPLYYVESWEVCLGASALKTTNETSQSLGQYESLKEAAVEPYSALRDAYIQYRAKCVER